MGFSIDTFRGEIIYNVVVRVLYSVKKLRRPILKIAWVAIIVVLLSGCGVKPVVSLTPPSSSAAAAPSSSTFVPLGIKISDAAPDFKLLNLDGETVSLSQYQGRPVFLNVWSFT